MFQIRHSDFRLALDLTLIERQAIPELHRCRALFLARFTLVGPQRLDLLVVRSQASILQALKRPSCLESNF